MEKLKSPKNRQNPLFEKGSLVEVRSTDPGFDGSWYEATILETPKHMRNKYTVEYKTLLTTPPSSKRSKKEKASSLLKEKVCMSLIRPSSPCKRDRNAVFEVFQEVEAYHNDGWWPGVILKKMDEIGDDGSYKYSVAFPLSREVFSFRAYDLRKKMVWVADHQGYSWKSNDQLCNYDDDTEEELYKTTFHVGTRVEVSYDKDNYGACWFAATILQIIGRTYCLVEYETLRADNDNSANPSLEEVVDMQYIRPCPLMNMSEPAMSIKELDKVEAFYNSGWFLGTISAILPNSMYVVRMPEQDKEVLVPFDRAALRIPLVWEDGQWDEMSQDKDDEVAHRSKGQRFKRSKTRKINSLTDDQFTQPLKKLKKLKNVDGDKSPHKSSPSHVKDVKNTVPSSENRSKSRKVRHDSTSNHKDESTVVNNTSPPSEKCLKSREVRRDSTSKHNSSPSDKDGNAQVNNTVRSSERRKKFREDRLLPEAKNPTSIKNKDVVDLKEPNSHNISIASDACPVNEASHIESVTENAEIFQDIIDLDIVEVDHGTQNGSVSDKGLSNGNVIENESVISDEGNGNVPNKENVMENGSVSGEGNESALSKALSTKEMIELVESTDEVLRLFPQEPHFQPLLTQTKLAKKGLACGLMITFTSLVNSIKELSIDASDREFDERFKTLGYVEEFGFKTEQVRARLEKLKEMHHKLTELQDQKTSTLSKAEELKKQQQMKDSKVSEIDEMIACLHEERTKVLSQNKKVEVEVEELQSVAMAVEQESMLVKLKFDEIANASW